MDKGRAMSKPKSSQKKSKNNKEIKVRKIRGKEKDVAAKQVKEKKIIKATKKEKFVKNLNFVSINFLAVVSSVFIISSMALGLYKISQGRLEDVLAALICGVFVIVGTWFNERIS